MFYGEFAHSLDQKGRLIIPSKLREVAKDRLIDRFFVTRGLDRCLFMFTEEEWRLQESKLRNLPFTKGEFRKFNRLFFSGASDCQCDPQGRILIPPYLQEHAQLKKNVVLVGVSNRIEIWSKELWKEFCDSNQDSYEDFAERLMSEN